MDHLRNILQEIPWQQVAPLAQTLILGLSGALLGGYTSALIASLENRQERYNAHLLPPGQYNKLVRDANSDAQIEQSLAGLPVYQAYSQRGEKYAARNQARARLMQEQAKIRTLQTEAGRHLATAMGIGKAVGFVGATLAVGIANYGAAAFNQLMSAATR